MSSQSHYKADPKEKKDATEEISDDSTNSPIQGVKYKKGTFVIKPKGLDITWGKDPRYWRIPQGSETTAELLQVCWLEVSGSIPLKRLEKNRKYKMSFIVSLKPDAFGWSGSPVYLMVKVGNKGFRWKSANLGAKDQNQDKLFEIPDDLTFEIRSTDTDYGPDPQITFGLYEIWRGRWKGGLVIHEVVISPQP